MSRLNPVIIPFIRQEVDGVKTIAILRVIPTSKLSQKAVLDALIKLITRWVKETKEGTEFYVNNGNDLNIGDLALCEERFNNWLLHVNLRAVGIQDYKIEVIAEVEGAELFDRPLVDPRRL
jgi:hypothetical protein